MTHPRRRPLSEMLGPEPPKPANSNEPDYIEQSYDIVRRLNRIHAFVAGKGVIREDESGGFAIESVRQFQDWYANDGIWTKTPSGADKFTSAAQIWMQSPERRQFESIVFKPNDTTPDAYNLWCGFEHHNAREGDSCERYLDHLF